MALALQGSDGKADAIFEKICHLPEFIQIRDDLTQTLADAHMVVVGGLQCEGATYDGFKVVKDLETIDQLDAMSALITNANKHLSAPERGGASLEDDELCQLSTTLLMLKFVVKNIAG